ncbi:MAG: rod shape-determining protein RodA [Bacteroidales bacterium]|jgi:rod shape determining protein RodA|nr:rod shape-determining protein RodA [Bacteroidales bacterium]
MALKNQDQNIFSNIDWKTVGIYIILVAFGWMNIYSAVYDETATNVLDLSRQHGKQLLWIGIAFITAIFTLTIDSRFFSTMSYVIYGLVLVLLVVVLFTATVTKGATSWISIGSFKLQPSEFAKFATALTFARYLSTIDVDIRRTSTKFRAACIIMVPAVLVLLQHDTGSALVFASFLLPFFREGMSGKILVWGTIAVSLFIMSLAFNKFIVVAILFLILLAYVFLWLPKGKRVFSNIFKGFGVFVCCCLFVFSVDFVFDNVLEPHQQDRIYVLIGKSNDPSGVDYNVNQSKIAIGSGQFIGKGFLNGTQTKYNFVPEQETDFIFCTVGEEWGFVGSTLLVALYVYLLVRLIIMAERQRSRFSRVYGYSVASILFVHFMINIGMVLGLLPVIGIPLPYFSYGGSSLIAFTLLLFVFIRQDAVRNQLL